MKNLILALLLVISVNLISFEISHNGTAHQISLENLGEFELYKIETTRNKDGKIKDDKWEGILLSDLLNELNIMNYDLLKFSSEDNYQVRLTSIEVQEYSPILSLKRNGKILSADKIRLVGAELRDMFWIQGIAKIETETYEEKKFPHTIYFAEAILRDKVRHAELKPFTGITGYRFGELAAEVFPNPEEELLLVGKDGVQHRLKYSQFLAEAVLEYFENDTKTGSYLMKSPQMPAGMWIKNLAYIQGGNKAIIFKNQFKDAKEISQLLGWGKIPESLEIKTENAITKESSDLPFSADVWQNAVKLVW